jgi:hypothetical protein
MVRACSFERTYDLPTRAGLQAKYITIDNLLNSRINQIVWKAIPVPKRYIIYGYKRKDTDDCLIQVWLGLLHSLGGFDSDEVIGVLAVSFFNNHTDRF